MEFRIRKDAKGKSFVETSLTDYSLITNPLLNKGMAFPDQERHDFRLFGLIPPHEASLSEQTQRSYLTFQSKHSDLERYLYLRDLQDSNETLFYRLLSEHLEEMVPIVYTPTVGLACQKFSQIYRRPRGIFVAYPYRDRIDEILANPRFDSVQVMVISDGERILGLGDQGAGGMGIPIGKLTLYTACGGIHPANTLPILLDVGTDNENLLKDPLYIGWRHKRIRGQEFFDFVEKFVVAVRKRFPKVLLQWEDFAQQNASFLLEQYRDQICSFNDDIQGAASAALATLLSALYVSENSLSEQRIVIVGAGSAGIGISHLIMQAMIEDGLSETEARSRFYLVDANGLLIENQPGLQSFQTKFAQSPKMIANWKLSSSDYLTQPPKLLEVIKNAKPTVLIGVCGQPDIFNEKIIREMAKHVKHPIIFPLSNPTERSEAKPQDLYEWTDQRAIVSTGSPFPPVHRNNELFQVDQTNNSYIFPGLGLGLIVVEAKRVTDKMFMIAAKTLAEYSPVKLDRRANLLPAFNKIREISFHIAFAIAKEAIKEGLVNYPGSDEELAIRIRDQMWIPEYLSYQKT